MKIIKLLQELRDDYASDFSKRKNGTMLLGPEKVPKCRHMLFAPLSEENINTYLISEYKNEFPREYITFLKKFNGANLYFVKLNAGKISIAHPMIVIFGLPLTAPFGRPLDMEEPYDLRVEDLARHVDIPMSWLKCGTYIKDYNFKITHDIFIDTQSKKVFSVEKNKKDVVEEWENMDQCVCDLYRRLLESDREYKY